MVGGMVHRFDRLHGCRLSATLEQDDSRERTTVSSSHHHPHQQHSVDSRPTQDDRPSSALALLLHSRHNRGMCSLWVKYVDSALITQNWEKCINTVLIYVHICMYIALSHESYSTVQNIHVVWNGLIQLR